MYPCPCCGYQVFSEPPGSYEICPICFWEDDGVQLAFPDLAGGANKCSLIDAQKNFTNEGACELRFKSNVRVATDSDVLDPSWRQLDPMRDRCLRWADPEDHERWQRGKNNEAICLYFWSPQYWLIS